MWSDNETAVDLLSVKHLVHAVTSTIQNERILPATIGIYGDWGSGKSSLIKMVAKELEKQDGVVCLTFNGWLFEDYEDAKTALMGTILDEIKENRTLSDKALELFKNLMKRVDWFRVAGFTMKHAAAYFLVGPAGNVALAGTDLLNAAKSIPEKLAHPSPADLKVVGEKIVGADAQDLKKFTKDPSQDSPEEIRKNIRDFRQDFQKLLEESKIKTLVVFIDDLDRCLPDTVIETLEAIKLFLFVPGTAFVISAAEKMVEKAVERRFPDPNGDGEISRNYLEKLIQFPIRIPSLGRNEVKTYMNLMFAELRLGNGFDELVGKIPTVGDSGLWDIMLDRQWFEKNLTTVPLELAEDLTMTQQIGDVLAETLNGNPRQVKRFLNTLLIRIGMAESRGLTLQKRILAKLMVLEYKRPWEFKTLAQFQAQEEGKPKDLSLLENQIEKQSVSAKPSTATKSKETLPQKIDETVHVEFSGWLEDTWLKNWLNLEPKLATVDLRPYFHVSKDRIGAILGPTIQLSNDARAALSMLLSPAESQQLKGVEDVKKLTQEDAANVVEVLSQRLLSSENSEILDTLTKVCGAQPLLINKVIMILKSIPESRVSIGTPIKVLGLKKLGGDNDASINQLITKWSNSTENPALKQATANALKRN